MYFGFQAKKQAPPEAARRRKAGKLKHRQQLGALDLSEGETPSPACQYIHFMGSRKDLGVGIAREG